MKKKNKKSRENKEVFAMASREIKVTTATLRAKKSELQALNQKFNSKLSEMDGTERQLTAMWEGDASKAFHKSFEKDTKKMDELYKAVAQYCEALDTIIRQYEKSEQKNVSIARKRTY